MLLCWLYYTHTLHFNDEGIHIFTLSWIPYWTKPPRFSNMAVHVSCSTDLHSLHHSVITSCLSDPLHTYFGVCGLSLIGEPSVLKVHPALNVSYRAFECMQQLHRTWRESCTWRRDICPTTAASESRAKMHLVPLSPAALTLAVDRNQADHGTSPIMETGRWRWINNWVQPNQLLNLKLSVAA